MRVKRGTTRVKRRKRILKKTKGFKWGRKNKIKLAQTAATKAGAHAYRDRRVKKRTSRALWQIRINAAARQYDMTYSKLIKALKDNKVELDRKVLSDLTANHPKIFETIIKLVK